MFLESERLYLREVQTSDVNNDYYRWMNDPGVTCYLEARFFPNSAESLKKYVERMLCDRENVFLAIILKEGQLHIGNIKLGPINWVHRTGDIGLLIGRKECWGKGYATEAISLLVEYAFTLLNLHKVTASAYDLNQGSVTAFQKAGFEIEGRRRQQVFCGGTYVDIIMMGLVNETSGCRPRH